MPARSACDADSFSHLRADPSFYRDVLSWISLFELDLFAFMPFGCAFDISFYDKLVVRTALPVFVIGALGLTGWWLKRRRPAAAASTDTTNKKSEAAASALGVSNSLFGWSLFLIFLLYPGCCSTAFSTFICSTLDDGTRYLRRDASLDCDASTHSLMESYAIVMIFVWPLGVPLLYSFGFWWYWPIISKLRRAEIRAKSTHALSKVRRQSVGDQILLEGELLASIETIDDSGDGEGSDGGGDTEPESARTTLADGRYQVALKHGRLEIHRPSGPPQQLDLVAGCTPQLGGDGKELVVAGALRSVTSNNAGGQRVRLTLAPPSLGAAEPDRKLSLLGVQLPSSLTRGLTGLTTSRSAPGSVPSLHTWKEAIGKEVPDQELSIDDAEEELRTLRLAPILLPYTLRCFWCIHRT